jgi:hypothetical protein
MAFIKVDNTVISFAEFKDVVDRDQRLFDSNEGLTDDTVEDALERATERILSRLRSSQWWRSYWLRRNPNASIQSAADIPALDPNRISARVNDFTDMCVYLAMAQYILPQVANFGDEADDDRNKMGWYENRYENLFKEMIEAGDWYDFDDDGVIASNEKSPGQYNLKRVR